jgi:hypothetical protein
VHTAVHTHTASVSKQVVNERCGPCAIQVLTCTPASALCVLLPINETPRLVRSSKLTVMPLRHLINAWHGLRCLADVRSCNATQSTAQHSTTRRCMSVHHNHAPSQQSARHVSVTHQKPHLQCCLPCCWLLVCCCSLGSAPDPTWVARVVPLIVVCTHRIQGSLELLQIWLNHCCNCHVQWQTG